MFARLVGMAKPSALLRDQRARGDELTPARVPHPPDGTVGARSQ